MEVRQEPQCHHARHRCDPSTHVEDGDSLREKRGDYVPREGAEFGLCASAAVQCSELTRVAVHQRLQDCPSWPRALVL
eukprot:5458415-Lingulodinium_polyedra.AAC.1